MATDFDAYEKITEGKATILFPKGNEVFYNPIQQFNRDISVLGIKAWSHLYEQERSNKKRKNKSDATSRKQSKLSEDLNNGKQIDNKNEDIHPESNAKETSDSLQESRRYIEIIEALSASGLRAIRYALEIPNVKTVIANDFSANAVDSIKRNSKYCLSEQIVQPNQSDATILMYQHKQKPVHVVDLDPYGSATPFMDSAVQSVRDGGLLLVTCTDLGVLAGNGYPEKCFSQYGGQTFHSDASHESALRLVLHMVASTAAKYGRSIEPLLSLSIDFYVRLFIRVSISPIKVKNNASRTMIVYGCNGCRAYTTQSLGKTTEKNGHVKYGYAKGPSISEKCPHCDYTHSIAGPMWGGPIHNTDFIDKMLELHKSLDDAIYKTLPRIQGMLVQAKEELSDVPFYFSPQSLSSIVRTSSLPQRKFVSALCNAGYRVSSTHALPGGIKTDAPFSYIWDIYRQWIEDSHHGEISKRLKPSSPGSFLLQSLGAKSKVVFEDHPRALELEKIRKSKVVRYQENPTKNWGPKAKASKN